MSEGLKNIMYNYELTPPQKVWDKIAADLDDAALDQQFPTTLYQMELMPPEAAWDRISSTINEKEEKKSPRISRFVLYAAAAATVGLIVLIGYQIFYKSPGKTSLAKEVVVLPINEKQVPDSNPKVEPQVESTLTNNDEVIARLDFPVRTRRKTLSSSTSNYLLSSNLSDISNINSTDLHEEENILPSVHQESKLEKASRYILLMTPEGNIVRMSKKLGEFVCCVSGQEQDENCKCQLQEWRDKVMHSSSASPGNFMDVLNMVSTLQGSDN